MIYTMPRSIIDAALPGNTRDEKLRHARRILERLERRVRARADEAADEVLDELRGGMPLKEALALADSIGCTHKVTANNAFMLSHPFSPGHPFRFKATRYASEALVRWLRKAQDWQTRTYKPQPVIVPETPAPAAPEPEPELLTIPDFIAPRIMPTLTVWTVYSPATTDKRGYFVVRAHDYEAGVGTPREACTTHLTLEDARTRGVPAGLHRLECFENDDPVIIECWI